MANIFPVGKSKWDWLPKMSQVVEEGVEAPVSAEDDFNPNFEAIKDLPFLKDTSDVAPDAAPDVAPDATATPVAEEVAPAEAATIKEEVAAVAEAAKEVAEKAEALTTKVEEVANAECDKPVDAPKGEVEEIEIEITPEGGEDKKEECGCPFEKKPEDKPEEKMEKEGDDKKDEGEKKEATASSAGDFVKLSHTSQKTKQEIREYFTSLGFPKEYVEAMTKDYD